MNADTLKELKRIAERIKDQDGRCTRDPFFLVYEKERIPTDEEFSDEYEWHDVEDGEHTVACEYEAKTLDKWEEEGYEIPKRWQKIPYIERDKFVQAFFTEEGAKRYIERNGHNLKRPFIYADSFYRNAEMLTIRENLGELLKLHDDMLDMLESIMDCGASEKLPQKVRDDAQKLIDKANGQPEQGEGKAS